MRRRDNHGIEIIDLVMCVRTGDVHGTGFHTI